MGCLVLRLIVVDAPPAQRLGLVGRRFRIPKTQLEDVGVELAVRALGVGNLVVVLDLDGPLDRLVWFCVLG